MDLSDYLAFAETTAREAGLLTLKYFQTAGAKPDYKSDDTPVTIADQEAEQLIRQRIETTFPDHQIVGGRIRGIHG